MRAADGTMTHTSRRWRCPEWRRVWRRVCACCKHADPVWNGIQSERAVAPLEEGPGACAHGRGVGGRCAPTCTMARRELHGAGQVRHACRITRAQTTTRAGECSVLIRRSAHDTVPGLRTLPVWSEHDPPIRCFCEPRLCLDQPAPESARTRCFVCHWPGPLPHACSSAASLLLVAS